MKQFGKVLKFELKSYLRNKIFVGITVFMIIAIAIATSLPGIIASLGGGKGSSDEPAVMLIYSEDSELAKTSKSYFAAAFPDYDVRLEAGSVDSIKDKIKSEEAECAFHLTSASSFTYYVNNLSMYDTNSALASEVLREVYRFTAMVDGGIPTEDAVDIMSVVIEGEAEALGKDQMQNFFYTYIMIFALYTVILLYGQMVATNVASEKSSRAMELLITSAKPNAMMFGKVLASCIAGFTQLVLIFGASILFYNINKDSLTNPILSSIFNIPIDLFIYMIIFFILGFLIYAFLFGAIGSCASKLEDINTSVMPITFLFVAGFLIVVFSMSSGTVDNTVMKIASYVPFTSPMAMFTRICMSTVMWYEILISTVILAASALGVGVLSARIYRTGVLLYGTKSSILTVLKTVFKH